MMGERERGDVMIMMVFVLLFFRVSVGVVVFSKGVVCSVHLVGHS